MHFHTLISRQLISVIFNETLNNCNKQLEYKDKIKYCFHTDNGFNISLHTKLRQLAHHCSDFSHEVM